MKHEDFSSFKIHSCKKDRCFNLGTSMVPLPLYALCVSTIFCIFILSSSIPFRTTPKRDLDHHGSVSVRHQNGDQNCNLYKGRWVPNLNSSLYTNSSCRTIPDSKNCFKHGREDTNFLKWRWKPDGCELPQFDPKGFLRIVRGKTMAFIGDSVARNQMESLLCLLSKNRDPSFAWKHFPMLFCVWANFTFRRSIRAPLEAWGNQERALNAISVANILELGTKPSFIFDSLMFFRRFYHMILTFNLPSINFFINEILHEICVIEEETPVNIYEDSEDRFRTWKFPTNEFTLQMLWSRFLVFDEELVINGSSSGIFNLHIDKVDDGWAQRLPSIDFAIISDGHWFSRKLYLYERGQIIRCVYCNEPNISSRGLDFALRMSFRTALGFLNECKGCNGITTVVRTFSPAHFEHGTWNDGGSCNRTSPQPKMEVEFGRNYLELGSIQSEETERAKQYSEKEKRDTRFEVLDVTRAMLMRPDGHPGSYWGNKWMKGYNDCVHWCLPGPIDTWNDFLMEILTK